MNRAYFQSTISEFLRMPNEAILGQLARKHNHTLDLLQRNAWIKQICLMKASLEQIDHGHVFIEFAIPRMGKRADVVVLYGGKVIVLEYKVGTPVYEKHGINQVFDYALDLKNFHEGSHHLSIVPILVATKAPWVEYNLEWTNDMVARPILANAENLAEILDVLFDSKAKSIDASEWYSSSYKPTPTIIEAARALYEGHGVEEISRSDAGAINLSKTTYRVASLIEQAKILNRKTICFVTGVPGAGKTLAGLNLATERMKSDEDEHAVFLSGNGPLVAVLREALARDEVSRSKLSEHPVSKSVARQRANTFIQNIHHFRDDCLASSKPPIEKVVVFDEAQRAWNWEKTSRFMRDRKGITDFKMSEAAFLISAMNRHSDWCLIVCLIGNGQEINTGEAGIVEWFVALKDHYPDWYVTYSDQFFQGSDAELAMLQIPDGAVAYKDLHLGVSVRSFRAERLAEFVSLVIEGEESVARKCAELLDHYPLAITRNLDNARRWLKNRARGSERYGLVASSNALRLKPLGIHMKSKIDAPHWFLGDSEDVRSSLSLEDAASEFEVQGLELDWVGICWDANFRRSKGDWKHNYFSGTKWKSINSLDRKTYLANSYRVLLTRARQGMVVFVPLGAEDDVTREPILYDETYEYLIQCGFKSID